MALSPYIERRLLDAMFGGLPLSIPPTWWLGLSLAAIDDQAVLEPGGGNYARVEVPNDTSNWAASTGSAPATKLTLQDLAFPLASGDWGVPVAWFLADAPTGGTLWVSGPLEPQSIGNGGQPGVRAGELAVTLGPAT